MSLLAFPAMLLPGLTWWAWFGKRDQDPMISLAQVTGLSLALIALLAELVFLLGGSFSSATIIVLIILFGALSIAGFARNGLSIHKNFRGYLLIGLIFLALAIVWRLYQARDLLLPNWVDAQHHYLIIRSILEGRGLPDNLSPYLEVPFFYHYGFHAAAALFTAISGLPIGKAMLLFGQILNALIGLSTYALGKSLFKDWRPAAAAALLVSFVTRMPAYYLSWGRYTLTVGMILLPLAVAHARELLHGTHNKQDVLTLSILVAGVLLSHYFTALLLAIYLVILALVYLIPRWGTPLTALLGFSVVTLGTLTGLVLAAPWLLRVARFSTASTGVGLNLPGSFEAIFNDGSRWDYITNLLGPASNHWLLPVAGLGLILAFFLYRPAFDFGIWSLLLSLMTLPIGLTLRPFRDDHFAIILFLPITLWAAWLFWWIGTGLAKRLDRQWVTTIIMAMLAAAWMGWSIPSSMDVVNSNTVLITQDDLDALDWIAENTPENARFFINTGHWMRGVYRGVDGGGWLLPYTGRWAIVPTVFYSFSPDKDYVQQIIQWGERASQVTTCSEEFWALVAEADVDWIYIRKGVGTIQPEDLDGCEGIVEKYNHGKVLIYEIEP